MVTFEILDELMKVDDSLCLNDRIQVWFVEAVAEEEKFEGFLHDQYAGLRKSISKSQQLIADLEALGVLVIYFWILAVYKSSQDSSFNSQVNIQS
ncbi:hypothetical protein Tco_0938814 [Tanacetum coccineum]|uniref:Uncharacterized protein n=1 Tax=Tanacetum coccineum TaxID=301880 RepID=A0ABQ5DQ91_9ASTR